MKVRRLDIMGRKLPRMYGVAWVEYYSDCVVLYPIPFNLFLKWIREFWFYLKQTQSRSHYDKRLAEAFRAGREEHRHEVNEISKELSEARMQLNVIRYGDVLSGPMGESLKKDGRKSN